MEMIELPWLSWVGWAGFAGLMGFYWFLAKKKVLRAYGFGIFGGVAWFIIGVATILGYAATLPSLALMELVIIGLMIHGIIKWGRGDEP